MLLVHSMLADWVKEAVGLGLAKLHVGSVRSDSATANSNIPAIAAPNGAVTALIKSCGRSPLAIP
jgi:CBS-domain-containing membrane protein